MVIVVFTTSNIFACICRRDENRTYRLLLPNTTKCNIHFLRVFEVIPFVNESTKVDVTVLSYLLYMSIVIVICILC